MADTPEMWTEADSELYHKLAPVAVPARREQMAALLTLLPFSPEETFQAVEVGCGPGLLSHALLTCFPRATVLALDGSPLMRARAAARLSPFGPRARVEAFDLAAGDWPAYVQDAGAVLSSLCLHHLPGPDRHKLFAALHGRLADRSALLIADLVQPRRPEALALFAETWDGLAQAQSLAKSGSADLFDLFVQSEWNHYRFPDPLDRPSPLFEQLLGLSAAGFEGVDCFWLQAGHALYGGYKGAPAAAGVSYAAALRAVRTALSFSGKRQ